MSFNFRLPGDVDGPNHWYKGKELLTRLIRDRDPDTIGNQ